MKTYDMTETYLLVGVILIGAVAVAVLYLAVAALLTRPEPPQGRRSRPRRVDLSMWTSTWETTDTDAWMAPLRTGGTRVEHRLRATMRGRGLLLVRRAGRRALRLRQALARGGRS